MTDTWQKIINVMEFDWGMDVGNMVANFNYLLDICSGKYKLQTNEMMWGPSSTTYRGQCRLDRSTKALYKDLEAIIEDIFDAPAKGVYLNDIIGFLGYSTTFDISSLSEEKYLAATRNLHPVYEMDVWKDNTEILKDGRTPCNYLGTYRRWVEHTSQLSRNKTNSGEICIRWRK